MTKAKQAAAAATEQQPQQGGSYVRQPDGSLERVEWTEHDDAPAVVTFAQSGGQVAQVLDGVEGIEGGE